MGVAVHSSLRAPGSGYFRTAWGFREMLRYWRCLEIPRLVLPEPKTSAVINAAVNSRVRQLLDEAADLIRQCHNTLKPVRWVTEPTITTWDFGMIGKESITVWLHLSQ